MEADTPTTETTGSSSTPQKLSRPQAAKIKAKEHARKIRGKKYAPPLAVQKK